MHKPQTKAHPWHGIGQPADFPTSVNAFIEIVPGDTVKFEIDKVSGYLKIDRPQKYSNYIPALYGFIPKTYCGNRVALHALSQMQGKQELMSGDKDPLDICVITERQINSGNIIATCMPIGGFRLIDKKRSGRQDHCRAQRRCGFRAYQRHQRASTQSRGKAQPLFPHL